jgi:hypothetical protein
MCEPRITQPGTLLGHALSDQPPTPPIISVTPEPPPPTHLCTPAGQQGHAPSTQIRQIFDFLNCFLGAIESPTPHLLTVAVDPVEVARDVHGIRP